MEFEQKKRDRSSSIATGLAAFTMFSIFYTVFIAYRLDWSTTYDSPYFWNLEALDCPGEELKPVITLRETQDKRPDYVLAYNSTLLHHIERTLQQPVAARIKRVGYIWEFNYAEYYLKAVADRTINDGQIIDERLLLRCSYKARSSLDELNSREINPKARRRHERRWNHQI